MINQGNDSNSAIGAVNLQNVDFDASDYVVAAGNGGAITLIKNNSSANTGTILVSEVGNSSIIRGTLVYRTN